MLRPEDLLLVHVTHEGDAVLLHAEGELDIHSAPALVEHARRALTDGVLRMCIDLRDVHHLDSSGIAALVNIRRYVLRAGGALVVIAPGLPVRELLEMAGLERYFTILDTVDEALLTLA